MSDCPLARVVAQSLKRIHGYFCLKERPSDYRNHKKIPTTAASRTSCKKTARIVLETYSWLRNGERAKNDYQGAD
jgi:hypothetical protein